MEEGGVFSDGQMMAQPGEQYAQEYEEASGYSPGQQYVPADYQERYAEEEKKEGDNALVGWVGNGRASSGCSASIKISSRASTT